MAYRSRWERWNSLLLQEMRPPPPRRSCGRCPCSGANAHAHGSAPSGRRMHEGLLPTHHLLRCLHEILEDEDLEDVEAVSHLHGLRCAARRSVGEVCAAVATDHYDLRLRLQSGRERVRLAIRQEVDDAMSLEIDE